MFPDFQMLGRTISTYPLLAVAGVILAGVSACSVAKKRGYDDNVMIVFLLISGIGVFVGSHLLYGIINIRYIIALIQNRFQIIGSVRDLFEVLSLLFGGSVFYGGLIGGLITGALYCRIKVLEFGVYSAMAAPSIPLLHAFGRIGCFLGGCCYGVESRFGFIYTRSLVDGANGISRFPIQLVESLLNVSLYLLLRKLLDSKRFESCLLPLYLIIYPTGRFILEFWRGDSFRGFIFGLSTSQFISLPLLLFAVIMLIRRSGDRLSTIKD